MQPASSLGKYFGIEAGAIAGVTRSPNINRATTEDIDAVPHVFILGSLHLPMGIGVDTLSLKTSVEDFTVSYFSGGIKWTLTDSLIKIPLDIRARMQYVTTSLNFVQRINDVPIDVEYKSKGIAYNATISKKLIILEPYVGIGYYKSKSDILASAETTVFDVTVSEQERLGIPTNTTYYFGGINFDFFLFQVAGEYMKAFDVDRYSAKFSIAI